ncbi:hypothetical protein AVMA1855_22470 [Acidovorax sp. SUPP1855]|uniref:hypothetical protein n=1 Tax=Acidovorax sp. SUPP1855 TaxID=431774 RepID=UPI0023DE2AB7|nr:hypothetical protein [Acidovorax sp. SUPP1855]GKS86968.1 hypothetical protein AVMA1855_22470 [Acidovorax sp. SUPP1855]
MSETIDGFQRVDALGKFDENSWHKACQKLADQAAKGCGLSHDYYVKRFSIEIDNALKTLPAEFHPQAKKAAEFFDYASVDQIQETDQLNAANGICAHGIDEDCCPLGCGDRDD